VQHYANSRKQKGNKMDREVMRWILIASSSFYSSLRSKRKKREVGGEYAQLLTPLDYSDASVHSCIFLRFIDYSPQFLFRQIQSQDGFDCFKTVCFGSSSSHFAVFLMPEQEIRHAFSNLKSHLQKYLSANAPSLERKSFDLALKAGEWKQVLRVLDGPQKDQGFHLFCKQSLTEAAVESLLEIREHQRRKDAAESNRPYKEEPLLVAHHAIKIALWHELDETGREKWRDEAKAANKARERPRISEDRYAALVLFPLPRSG
jgi:hypothetical protein